MEAKKILKAKKNIRVLKTMGFTKYREGHNKKRESGGYLLQDSDSLFPDIKRMLNVTIKKPTKKPFK